MLSHVESFGVKEISAIEPNKRDAQFIGENHPRVIVHNKLLSECLLKEDSFDVIASFEVLEHVPNVSGFLESCWKTLRPGGKLVIEVPNHDDALLSKLDVPAYKRFYYHKAHIHYFTKKSLNEITMFSKLRGKVESFLMYPYYNHISWVQNDSPQGNADDALDILSPAVGADESAKLINEFYRNKAVEYEELLKELDLGDCLVFTGEKVR